MGMSQSNGYVNVTGTVTATASSPSTPAFLRQAGASTGTTTLGTVGAGKRWRIIHMSCGCSSQAASVAISSIKLNDVDSFSCSTKGTATTSSANNACVDFGSYSNFILTAGQTVKNEIVGEGWANIVYVEESV